MQKLEVSARAGSRRVEFSVTPSRFAAYYRYARGGSERWRIASGLKEMTMRNCSLLSLVLVAAISSSPVFAEGRQNAAGGVAANDRTTFYEVPLKCLAAPKIACGSRSKPVLFSLERRPAVAEAWVNRSGTVIAVVWKADSTAATRAAVISEMTSLHELSFRELGKDERLDPEHTFLARTNWYRSMDTGKLSEEEAHIIVERLVRRLVAEAPTAAPKAESLTARLFDVLRPYLLDSAGQSLTHVDLITVQNKLLSETRAQLDPAEFRAFENALVLPAFRPVGDES